MTMIHLNTFSDALFSQKKRISKTYALPLKVPDKGCFCEGVLL